MLLDLVTCMKLIYVSVIICYGFTSLKYHLEDILRLFNWAWTKWRSLEYCFLLPPVIFYLFIRRVRQTSYWQSELFLRCTNQKAANQSLLLLAGAEMLVKTAHWDVIKKAEQSLSGLWGKSIQCPVLTVDPCLQGRRVSLKPPRPATAWRYNKGTVQEVGWAQRQVLSHGLHCDSCRRTALQVCCQRSHISGEFSFLTHQLQPPPLPRPLAQAQGRLINWAVCRVVHTSTGENRPRLLKVKSRLLL